MKLDRFLMIVLLSFFSLVASAQQKNIEVKGVILDKNSKEPVEQATVRLLGTKDSTMLKGVASGKKGAFSFKNVTAGEYLLNVSYVGYDPLYQPLKITGKTTIVNVGELEIAEGGILLESAVVIGKAAEVVIKNDTIEYNADSYKVTEGSVLEDLLKKMPGVEIDTDGKVTVNGKEIKKIMVDGKEFFSDDPKVASKNLPAKMVDKVQVWDKKSDMALMTGFDDGEEEPVINLTIKPGMKQGWFGNAFAGYGSKDRYEGNVMVNRFLNNDQFTFMGGLNNTNNMGFSDLGSSMFSGMGGGGRRGMGGGMGRGGGNGITTSGNGGLNFSKEFNSKMTLGGNARYTHSENDAQSKSNTQNILNNDSSSYYNEINSSLTRNDNFSTNFRMEWKPDSMTNIIFTPNLGYSKSHSEEFGSFNTLSGDMDTVNVGESSYLSNGHGINFSGQLDFSRKLNTSGRVFSMSVSGGYDDAVNEGMNYSNTKYYLTEPGKQDEIIDQQFRYDNKGYNYRVYLSWVEPIGHNNFIQATYSINQRNQESLKKSYTADEETGLYTVLDTAYSKSYRNDFINQRASLSFRSQRERFNYTLGMNIDPSYSKSRNFVGDSTLSELKRSVVNLSPMAQFNYMFDKRTNLRISYSGRTSQPSMTQLQPVDDISDPLNTIRGNPDLNPLYSNDLSIRFQKFNPERQQAFNISASGNYVVNDIVSKTTYEGNTGKKITTYENINGNWSANIRGMFNSPFRNKKFSVNSMTMFSFANSNGYINGDKNTNKNINASERLGLNFRSDIVDLGINGSIRYNGVTNSLQGQQEQNTFNYGVGGNTTIYLPYNFSIESDINYSTNSGYAAGYEQKEVLWNASASKQFLKNNQGTLRFKIYDILHQRSNISRNITANAIQYSEYNTLTSYFMVHFIYRFSIFKGGGSASDMRGPGRGEGRGGMGRGEGPGPGGVPPF